MKTILFLFLTMFTVVSTVSCEKEIAPFFLFTESDSSISKEPSISEYNADKEAIIAGSRMLAGVYGKDTSEEFPTFLVVTDIHGNSAGRNFHAFERALDYAREKDFVESVLCLGDIGDDSHYLMEYDWSKRVLECGKPVLTIPGNHEFVYHPGQNKYAGFTDAQIFEKLYSGKLLTNNGEIHGGANQDKNYWYKDISKVGYDNVTRKIRVIGLYQYEYSEPDEDGNAVSRYKASGLYKKEQIEWLVNLLNTVEENMYVLILTHSAVIGKSPVVVENAFSPILYNWPSEPFQMAEGNHDFIAKIVNAWVTGVNGNFTDTFTYGETISITTDFATPHKNQFICFLCGHSHTDYIVKHREFNLYQVMFNCTALDQSQQLSDIPRQYSGKTMDCVTLFTYDWFNNQVRLIRLGSDVTIDMRERKYASFNI